MHGIVEHSIGGTRQILFQVGDCIILLISIACFTKHECISLRHLEMICDKCAVYTDSLAS